MAIDLNILGNNIRALRNSRRASQEEVTNFIHITRSTYSSFENGQKVPDLQTLDAICALYDISFDSLVNFDITKGILKRIYFDKCNQDVADLLTNISPCPCHQNSLSCRESISWWNRNTPSIRISFALVKPRGSINSALYINSIISSFIIRGTVTMDANVLKNNTLLPGPGS